MGKTAQRIGLGVATGGLSETVPALMSGDIVGAVTYGALKKPTGKANVPGVDPAILDLKRKQEAQAAAEAEQSKKRKAVLSDFASGPASMVSGGGRSVLGSNLFS
jgi:hypothetical protein